MKEAGNVVSCVETEGGPRRSKTDERREEKAGGRYRLELDRGGGMMDVDQWAFQLPGPSSDPGIARPPEFEAGHRRGPFESIEPLEQCSANQGHVVLSL